MRISSLATAISTGCFHCNTPTIRLRHLDVSTCISIVKIFIHHVLSPLLFAVYINDLIMSFPNNCGVYAILYADDILLISPTVCMLQNMLTTCELELQALGLSNQSHARKLLA